MPQTSLQFTIDIGEFAQRLWILERPLTSEPTGRADVFRFVSAVAVFAADEVGVGFIRSLDMQPSTDACLRAPRVRMTMERNLARFSTLDAAVGWADSKKRNWLERGWSERSPDPNEG